MFELMCIEGQNTSIHSCLESRFGTLSRKESVAGVVARK